MPGRRGSQYEFEAVGYQTFRGRRHWGTPNNLLATRGVRVRVTNVNDPEDTHMFWQYVYRPFKSWAEWWVYIGAMMEGHGFDLAE